MFHAMLIQGIFVYTLTMRVIHAQLQQHWTSSGLTCPANACTKPILNQGLCLLFELPFIPTDAALHTTEHFRRRARLKIT